MNQVVFTSLHIFLQFVHTLGTALWCSEERTYKMICPAQQQLWTVQVP